MSNVGRITSGFAPWFAGAELLLPESREQCYNQSPIFLVYWTKLMVFESRFIQVDIFNGQYCQVKNT